MFYLERFPFVANVTLNPSILNAHTWDVDKTCCYIYEQPKGIAELHPF